jgi:hypothetical protein
MTGRRQIKVMAASVHGQDAAVTDLGERQHDYAM